jgi:four helix bundle protein
MLKRMNAKNAPSYNQPPPPATGQKIYRTFEDLEIYQVAREFRKSMYQVNRQLPAFEKFELGSQIRRAAVSLTNNIAEGHGRFHYLEQIKFCLIARGSLEELLDDLNVCEDEAYLPAAEIGPLKQLGWRVHQVLNGYVRWLRAQKKGATLEMREESAAGGLIGDQLDELLVEPDALTASTL